jgi:hypothetical protein
MGVIAAPTTMLKSNFWYNNDSASIMIFSAKEYLEVGLYLY